MHPLLLETEVHWYRLIVDFALCGLHVTEIKYVCIYVCHLLKCESGFRFKQKWVHFVTLLLGAFLFCLHSAECNPSSK